MVKPQAQLPEIKVLQETLAKTYEEMSYADFAAQEAAATACAREADLLVRVQTGTNLCATYASLFRAFQNIVGIMQLDLKMLPDQCLAHLP